MPPTYKPAPRAVILPERFNKTRDVLEASLVLTYSTPCPFGIGIYSMKSEDPDKLLPLIYVSDKVAQDRSPATHMWNGAGVRAGWYCIAEPGKFEVVATYVNKMPYGYPSEDGLYLRLHVDGEDVNQNFAYKQMRNGHEPKSGEALFDGFLERSEFSITNHREARYEIRPFVFEKMEGGEGIRGGSEVGTIRLKVEAGQVQDSSAIGGGVRTFSRPEVQLSEKLRAKEGRTLKVGRNAALVEETIKFANFWIANRREVSEAEVVVYVRERSWLRSRRLIDDNDKPCTYKMFQKLLKRDNPQKVDSGIVDVDEAEQPDKKKRRIKDEVLIDDTVKPKKSEQPVDLPKNSVTRLK